MLSSDLYDSDALNYFMLFFPDQITNFYDFIKIYSRSTLYTISWSASLRCFYLICIIQTLYSWSLSLRSIVSIYQCQLGWYCAEYCMHCAIFLVQLSWVPGHGIVPVHIQNYSPVNGSMTWAMKDNSWNSKKYLITFYMISWFWIWTGTIPCPGTQFYWIKRIAQCMQYSARNHQSWHWQLATRLLSDSDQL